jgi:hypothetical protein
MLHRLVLTDRQVSVPSYVTDLIRHNQYIVIIIIIIAVTNIADSNKQTWYMSYLFSTKTSEQRNVQLCVYLLHHYIITAGSERRYISTYTYPRQ